MYKISNREFSSSWGNGKAILLGMGDFSLLLDQKGIFCYK